MNCRVCNKRIPFLGNHGTDTEPCCFECANPPAVEVEPGEQPKKLEPIPEAADFPAEWKAKKAGQLAAGIPIAIVVILQVPFLGLYMSILRGQLADTWPFLLVDAAVVLFFVWLVRLYSGIAFGYDESGVYYRGIRKTLRTNWADVSGIRKIWENRVWTAVDVVDDDKVSNPEARFAYAIDSHVGPTIYIQKYFPESRYFARAVSAKSRQAIDATAIKPGILEALKAVVT